SNAQNKVVANGKFHCIDTGHAFERNAVAQLSSFFTLFDESFKNYTVFTGPRHLIMPGVIRMALIAGYKVPQTVLESYGLQPTVPVGADEKIFDDYAAKFTMLQADFQRKFQFDNSDCCKIIVNDINKNKKWLIDVRNQFLKKFSKFLFVNKKACE